MIRINLLPHREEKRKARRQQFFVLAGLVSVLAAVIVFAGYGLIDQMISAQLAKNNFLKAEVAVLDKQIDEIKRLREQTQLLLSRKQVIESLQRDRSEAVHLLNELASQTPEGIYLKTIKQDGGKIVVTGFTQSNSRVSHLMRNIEASSLIEKPVLQEIKTVVVGKRKLNEFSLSFQMKRPTDDKSATVSTSGAAGAPK